MPPRIAISLALALAAPHAAAGDLTLDIRHLFNGKPLADGERIQTAVGESLSITRLSYLLSHPAVLQPATNTASRAWLERDDWFAFVDAAGNRESLTLRGLPAARYTALRFQVGVDRDTDASDPSGYPARHPLNPVVNNLHWTPQGGYIYLALEGHRHRTNAPPSGFAYHLGNHWNLMTVALPVSLDLTHDRTVVLDFHLDRLFDSDPALRVEGQPSTHAREGDQVATVLRDRVQEAFTLRSTSASTPPASNSSAPPSATRQFVGTPYRFRLAHGFPVPDLPTDVPLTNERVALGEKLFVETRLSRSHRISCSSCHQHEAAFADPRRFSAGEEEREGTRNSMPLFNLAWKTSFFWDGRSPTLREQVLEPIGNPVEMHQPLTAAIGALQDDAHYPALFEQAFGSPEITAERLALALEQFLLTLTSYDSRFDQAARGEASLTDEEKRGFELFMTEHDPRRGQFGADCFHCHGGALFSDHRFHNNGLRDDEDYGLESFTGRATDRNKFATPSLRNVALTAPYMHDGRFRTLEEVVDHYDAGLHRSPSLDPNLAKHPPEGLGLSRDDKAALVAFLRTLSDPQFER